MKHDRIPSLIDKLCDGCTLRKSPNTCSECHRNARFDDTVIYSAQLKSKRRRRRENAQRCNKYRG